MLTFDKKNKKENSIYRPAAYALIKKEGKILILKVGEIYALPGGGIEKDEEPKDALKRELLEEIGYRGEIGELFCRARAYFSSNRSGKNYFGDGYFYPVELIEKIKEPIEIDHFMEWVEWKEAVNKLALAYQRHAVFEYMKR